MLPMLLWCVGRIPWGIVSRSEDLFLIYDLIVDQLSVIFKRKLNIIVNVELDLGSARSYEFHLFLIIELRKVLMLQYFFNGETLGWIELK